MLINVGHFLKLTKEQRLCLIIGKMAMQHKLVK
jgi:hypothetical protein